MSLYACRYYSTFAYSLYLVCLTSFFWVGILRNGSPEGKTLSSTMTLLHDNSSHDDNSPHHHHHHPHHDNDFSEFLFLGNSMTQFQVFYPQDNIECMDERPLRDARYRIMLDFWEDSSHLPLSEFCAAEPTYFYCASSFYQAYPNAINAARSGYFIHQWEKIFHSANENTMFVKLAKVPYIKYIVFVLGRNDAEIMSPLELLEHFKNFIGMVHDMFPTCLILIASISLRPLPYNKIEERDWNKNITDTNALLKEYSLEARDPSYLHYADICSDFYLEGTENQINYTLFNQESHFTQAGYITFERAFKREISRILG